MPGARHDFSQTTHMPDVRRLDFDRHVCAGHYRSLVARDAQCRHTRDLHGGGLGSRLREG
jgi:hypothetical protein